MAMQRRETVIDGTRYEVTTLDAYTAVPVWHKVAKVIAPVLNALSASGAAIVSLSKDAKASELAVLGKLATSAGEVAIKHMDPVDLRYCIDAFANATSVQVAGSDKSPKLPTVFADHFAGNLVGMMKWFHFCLEVNFGDFLEAARGIMTSARSTKPASDAKSETTATPPSESPAASTP